VNAPTKLPLEQLALHEAQARQACGLDWLADALGLALDVRGQFDRPYAAIGVHDLGHARRTNWAAQYRRNAPHES